MKDRDIFNWSRTPSRDTITQVYIAQPNAYSTFAPDYITKNELINSLHNFNVITDLHSRKKLFKNLFVLSVCIIPFTALLYNLFTI